MIVTARAYPRAGLAGNPSDGYFGKTISFTFSNFLAEVVLYQTPELEILPNVRDHSRFNNIHDLFEDVRRFGYYGGVRLLKATIKRFYDHCLLNHISLHDKNFTIRYHSNIPSQVGLAGSSAIIIACLRALMLFYEVRIPRPEQANLALSVEKDELGITAGLQDRVAQVYEGLVYMDFDRNVMEQQGRGRYEEMDPDLLPPLYIGYKSDLAEESSVFHNDIRGRFERKDAEVVAAMRFWADLSDQVRQCLLKKERSKLGELLNSNFDMRHKIYNISSGNSAMVDMARATGASAKFPGSGGAIIGTYADEAMYDNILRTLGAHKIKVFKPVIKMSERNTYDS